MKSARGELAFYDNVSFKCFGSGRVSCHEVQQHGKVGFAVTLLTPELPW